MPTQKQQNSLTRIRRAIEIIQQTAPAEIEQESREQRRTMAKAYESMVTHAHHLGIRPRQLGTYYKPEQYLAHANAMLAEVNKLYDESIIEKAALTKQGFRLMR
jgi:tRNA A37 N6-isopentenylltransferase MiaA